MHGTENLRSSDATLDHDAARADIGPLIIEHIPALRRYAHALLRSRDKADDLVQDCLLLAIDRAGQWHRGTNLRAWLFKILYNKFISDMRRQALRLPSQGIGGRLLDEPVKAAQHTMLACGELERAVRELPTEQRTTLLLVALEGMNYEEAAEISGVPVGTVRSRLSRARQALRQRLLVPEAEPAAHQNRTVCSLLTGEARQPRYRLCGAYR
jgi:RNA polymerase sigma-70 factor, ECF subfamily